MSDWQPIETAPKDGTDILVLLDVAGIWVVHIGWWRSHEEVECSGGFDESDVGWWAYTRGSVTQEMLDGPKEPVMWAPFNPPEDK